MPWISKNDLGLLWAKLDMARRDATCALERANAVQKLISPKVVECKECHVLCVPQVSGIESWVWAWDGFGPKAEENTDYCTNCWPEERKKRGACRFARENVTKVEALQKVKSKGRRR
jgi:hypothetical protein